MGAGLLPGGSGNDVFALLEQNGEFFLFFRTRQEIGVRVDLEEAREVEKAELFDEVKSFWETVI